jgi:hypothetical protein
MNSPEWIFLLIGCSACVAIGVSQSLHAFLFSKIVQANNIIALKKTTCRFTFQVLHSCMDKDHYHQAITLSCLLLLLGLFTVLIRFFQVRRP